jgi:fluoride exporter
MIIVEVALAGALGAVLRHLADHLVQHRLVRGWPRSEFPLGIMAVNLSGSLALGLLVGLGMNHGLSATWVTIGGVGLIGSYTTFSTFTFDTVRLAGEGRRTLWMLNVIVSITAGLGAAAGGLALGSLS